MDYMAQTKRLWPLAVRCDLPFLSQCDRHRQGSCGISGSYLNRVLSSAGKPLGSFLCMLDPSCTCSLGLFDHTDRVHTQFGFIWPHGPCADAVWVYLTTRTVCTRSFGLFDHTDCVHAQFGFIWPHGPCAHAVWVYLTTRTVCTRSLGLFDHTDRVHAQLGFIWPHGPCAHAVWVYLTTRTVCTRSLGLFDHTDRVHAQFVHWFEPLCELASLPSCWWKDCFRRCVSAFLADASSRQPDSIPIASHCLLSESSTPLLNAAIAAQEAAATLSRPTKPIFWTFRPDLGVERFVRILGRPPPLRQRRRREGWPSLTYPSLTWGATSGDSGVQTLSRWKPGMAAVVPWLVVGRDGVIEGRKDCIGHGLLVMGMGSDCLPVVARELGDRRMCQLAVATTTKSDAFFLLWVGGLRRAIPTRFATSLIHYNNILIYYLVHTAYVQAESLSMLMIKIIRPNKNNIFINYRSRRKWHYGRPTAWMTISWGWGMSKPTSSSTSSPAGASMQGC